MGHTMAASRAFNSVRINPPIANGVAWLIFVAGGLPGRRRAADGVVDADRPQAP